MIYDKSKEAMPREELAALRDARLCAQVRRMYDRVPLFKQRMDERDLSPDDIKGVKDLRLLPFSYKSDLRDNYPYGLFAVPMTDIVRLHASSGTTGKQIVVGYTENDLDMWSQCMARMYSAAGADKDSFIQIAFGYGLFTGGLGAHYGAEKVGATVIPSSAGNTERQINTLVDLGSTHICCTPSYALYLAEAAEAMGVTDKLKLRAGIFGAEPWSEQMRSEIERRLHIKAYNVYGLSEIMGPGVAYECECQNGMHINEDMFIAEVIDPDTEEVLPYGEQGELVFTTLTKEGLPFIRYRTKDICTLTDEPCACGRTSIRMGRPAGRSDDMLIVRGVNVFPSQIEEVLIKLSCGKITPNYQIVVDRVNNQDTFDVNVEMSESFFRDDIGSIAQLEKRLTENLRSALGIGARVHIVNPRSIVRSEGKAKRVIDNRKY